MVHCERCSSRYHSARALMIENCPRCLLRDDVAAPLVAEAPVIAPVEQEEAPLGSQLPAPPPLDPEPA